MSREITDMCTVENNTESNFVFYLGLTHSFILCNEFSNVSMSVYTMFDKKKLLTSTYLTYWSLSVYILGIPFSINMLPISFYMYYVMSTYLGYFWAFP